MTGLGRILVTGGAGFIGSNYVRRLLSGYYPGWEHTEVVVLDKLTYAGNKANLDLVVAHPNFRFVHADITDRGLLAELMPGVDAVVHFAAESHVDRSINSGDEFVMTNVVGTQSLLDAALSGGVQRFVHVSTDEVYGSIDEGSWDETAPLQPNSPYSAAKASSDLFARAYFQTHGLPVITTRCSNNYGPFQHVEKMIPLFVTNLLDGKSVPLYGDGGNVRDWLHVDDHCSGIQTALNAGQPGETYNIGGGVELTNRELTQRLLDATGTDWRSVNLVADRLGHDRRYSVDDAKIRKLGYVPARDLDTSLIHIVQWYEEHEDWWRPVKEKVSTD